MVELAQKTLSGIVECYGEKNDSRDGKQPSIEGLVISNREEMCIIY